MFSLPPDISHIKIKCYAMFSTLRLQGAIVFRIGIQYNSLLARVELSVFSINITCRYRQEHLNHFHFQNFGTNNFAYTVFLYQNVQFQTCGCSMYYESGLLFDKCIVFYKYYKNEVSVITIKTMVYVEVFSCYSASKRNGLCNIFTYPATFTSKFVAIS